MASVEHTASFSEWKRQYNSGADVANLALRRLVIGDGLAYGRVNIASIEGSRLVLAHFAIDEVCRGVTAARLHTNGPEHFRVFDENVTVPDGPVVGLFWQDDEVEQGKLMTFQYSNVRQNRQRGAILFKEIGDITIEPYPGGYQEGELYDLMRPTRTLLDGVFAAPVS